MTDAGQLERRCQPGERDTDGHKCHLVSRCGHVFAKWDRLCEEIADSVRSRDTILDAEFVCLDADGRSNFYRLLFRRDSPSFYAFDVTRGRW